MCNFGKKIWETNKTFYVRTATTKIFKRMVTEAMATNVGVRNVEFLSLLGIMEEELTLIF